MANSKAATATPMRMSEDEKKWRAKDDMRTLSQAEEIKRDKDRHSAAQKMAQEEMSKIAVVAQAEPKDTTEKTTKSTGKESMDAFARRRDKKDGK